MWRILFLALGLTACTLIEEKAAPPNILLIVADDLGYSDIGAFGGEISTPNLDRLAAKGMVLSNFHTGPTCSVSRSMLMSGRDNHIAGLGNMAETVADNQLGKVGYEGYLNDQVDTIAEVLKSAGYHTYMAGKWHLGMQPEQSPKHRGFDQSFALLYGGGSHFADMAGGDAHRHPLLYRNNGRLLRELPEDFYSTTFYTDKLIRQIDSNVNDGKPFFAYLAYTAPHWPLQAPREVINKYRGRYDQGYDAIREARFATQKRLGLFDASTSAPSRPEQIKPWTDLTADEQRFHARNMEVYAAMVDYMDRSIGRVIHYLSEQGRLDNTLVVFISDNGAEHWNYSTAPPPVGKFAARFDNSPDNIGNEGSFAFYGAEWAHVSNTPYTRYKGTTYEGGIRSPAIVFWPGKTLQGKVSPALTFITDWYATFSALGSTGSHQTTGKNLAPLLTGAVERVRKTNESIGLEVWGRRGILRESYKLVSSPGHPHGETDWELYNLQNDPAERHNLVEKMPDVFAAMQRSWREYVANNNVIVPQGPFKIRLPEEKPVE